ncbi:BON domain-containing protein [Microbacterium sp. P01]|uniref:BON domain-containing protein n=1 Tax=Microbacterium sp. P01 TaxID=3366261 RepID=UPI00366B8079
MRTAKVVSNNKTAQSDEDQQAAIQEELKRATGVDFAGIGVAVENSTITLAGEVDTYAELLSAKRAALRVRGVSTIVDELRIHPEGSFSISETDVAKEVDQALKSTSAVPDTVTAEVVGHRVTLAGEVYGDVERDAAQQAVQHLRGVVSVDNRITRSARPSASDTEERIRNAIVRNAQLDANHVTVTAEEGTVLLHGRVRSWAEKDQAASAAWASPHVTHVDNRIVVRAD